MLTALWFTLGVLPLLTQNASAQTDTTAASRINFDDLTADADKPLYLRYGIFGGYNFSVNYTADFGYFYGCITCAPASYGSQSSKMLTGGLLFEYPLWNRLGVSLRASYSVTPEDKSFYKLPGFAEDQKTLLPSETSFLATTFRQRESLTLTGNGQSFVDGTIEHRLNLQLKMISLEPTITYRLLDALTLYAGGQFSFFASKDFHYAEFILSPDDRVYIPENKTVRRDTTGSLPFLKSVLTSLVAGISYEIPLNASGTVLLAPEFFLSTGLGRIDDPGNIAVDISNNSKLSSAELNRRALKDSLYPNAHYISVTKVKDSLGNIISNSKAVIGDGKWSLGANFRAGISLRISPFRTIRPEMTPEIQETIRKVKRLDSIVADERRQNAKRIAQVDSLNRAITVKMEELKKIGISVTLNKVVGVDETGKEIPKPTITVEQFRAQTVQPLLSHVYFDENSFVLPSRYRRIRAADRNGFKISDAAGKSNIELYRNVLNIVGQRMNESPAAVLFLTGCNSGQGVEKDNIKLSEQRAVAVSDYLQDVWKIAPKRIVVQKQNMPDKPAGNDATGQAENRRVEMSSNVPEIFDAVKTDQITKISSPPTIRLGMEINAGAGLKQWELEVTQFVDNEAQTLKSFNGTNNYPPSVDWNINQEPATMPGSGQDLSVQLTMTDINNKTGDAPIVSIPVKQITVEKKEVDNKTDKRIDTYDLIGFDFGTNTVALDESGQKLLESIKKNLKPGASATVTGYTDITGDAEKNRALAQRRAEFIAKSLGAPNVKTKAVGPTKQHDNELPEGRAYNRYVHVEVQTPVR